MALQQTLPTQAAGGLPIADYRLINAGMVEKTATGLPRLGVLAAHYDPLVVGTNGMAYSIGKFVAVVSRLLPGCEFLSNDSALTVATTAAPASNSRIDVVWVRPRFPLYGDGSLTDPIPGVTQGVAAASPVKPAIPAGAFELATVVVPSTATTTLSSGVVITPTYQMTAMAGGVVPLRNQAEMDAWNPAEGARAFRIDLGVPAERRGRAWDYEVAGEVALGTLYRKHGGFDGLRLLRQGGRVRLRGTVTNGQAATFVANTDYQMGTVPAGFRPASGEVPLRALGVSLSPNPSIGWVTINTLGALRFAISTTHNAPVDGILFGIDMEYEVAS